MCETHMQLATRRWATSAHIDCVCMLSNGKLNDIHEIEHTTLLHSSYICNWVSFSFIVHIISSGWWVIQLCPQFEIKIHLNIYSTFGRNFYFQILNYEIRSMHAHDSHFDLVFSSFHAHIEVYQFGSMRLIRIIIEVDFHAWRLHCKIARWLDRCLYLALLVDAGESIHIMIDVCIG